MKIRKQLLTLGICTSLVLSMTACGSGEDTSTADSKDSAAGIAAEMLPEIPEGAIADASGTFIYTGLLQQGGDPENGYIQVPLGYVSFQEEGVEGLTQYSDVNGVNIITLDYYKDIDYVTAANSMRYYMEEEEYIEGLSGATVTVNGYNALLMYCHFTDDDKFLYTWFIEDPSNTANSYYLAMEFAYEDSDIVACSSTFQTAADYAAANPESAAE